MRHAAMQAADALTRGLLLEKVKPLKIVAANRQVEQNQKLRAEVARQFQGKLIARRDAILGLLGCKPVQSKVNTQRGT